MMVFFMLEFDLTRQDSDVDRTAVDSVVDVHIFQCTTDSTVPPISRPRSLSSRGVEDFREVRRPGTTMVHVNVSDKHVGPITQQESEFSTRRSPGNRRVDLRDALEFGTADVISQVSNMLAQGAAKLAAQRGAVVLQSIVAWPSLTKQTPRKLSEV